MKIITSFVYPPIPVRSNDWCAYFDELGADCSPHGWGSTEAEAVADLLKLEEQLEADRALERAMHQAEAAEWRAEYERDEAADAKRDAMRDDPDMYRFDE